MLLVIGAIAVIIWWFLGGSVNVNENDNNNNNINLINNTLVFEPENNVNMTQNMKFNPIIENNCVNNIEVILDEHKNRILDQTNQTITELHGKTVDNVNGQLEQHTDFIDTKIVECVVAMITLFAIGMCIFLVYKRYANKLQCYHSTFVRHRKGCGECENSMKRKCDLEQ